MYLTQTQRLRLRLRDLLQTQIHYPESEFLGGETAERRFPLSSRPPNFKGAPALCLEYSGSGYRLIDSLDSQKRSTPLHAIENINLGLSLKMEFGKSKCQLISLNIFSN